LEHLFLNNISTKCAAFVTAVSLSGLEEHFKSFLISEVRNVWHIYWDPHAVRWSPCSLLRMFVSTCKWINC